jgi:hypothetical protein
MNLRFSRTGRRAAFAQPQPEPTEEEIVLSWLLAAGVPAEAITHTVNGWKAGGQTFRASLDGWGVWTLEIGWDLWVRLNGERSESDIFSVVRGAINRHSTREQINALTEIGY